MVWKVRQAVSVPIMGIGGIASADDALQFLLAGASAVQIGTATFTNPMVGVTVVEGIRAYCERHGVSPASGLVGSLQL